MERDLTEQIAARIIKSNVVGKISVSLDKLMYRALGAPATRPPGPSPNCPGKTTPGMGNLFTVTTVIRRQVTPLQALEFRTDMPGAALSQPMAARLHLSRAEEPSPLVLGFERLTFLAEESS